MVTARGELNIHTDRRVRVPEEAVPSQIQTKEGLDAPFPQSRKHTVIRYCEMCEDTYEGRTARFFDRLCSGFVMMDFKTPHDLHQHRDAFIGHFLGAGKGAVGGTT